MVRLVFKNIFLILLNPDWTETWPELGLKKKNTRGDLVKIYWHLKKKLILIFVLKNKLELTRLIHDMHLTPSHLSRWV